MSLRSALDEYLREKLSQNCSAATLHNYRLVIEAFIRRLNRQGDNERTTAFTQDAVRGYLAELAEKGRDAGTRRFHFAVLSGFAAWGVDARKWRDNPVKGLPRIRAHRKIPRPFTPEELERLFALALNREETALRAMLYYTGLRVGTVVKIQLRHVQRPVFGADGTVSVGKILTTGKGGREHMAFIPPQLWPLLEDYILAAGRVPQKAHDDKRPVYLFGHADGRPWKVWTVQQKVRQWGQDAEVAKCTPHRFRHTFATDTLEQTGDLRLTQEAMGHQSPTTTAIYTKVTDQRREAAARTLRSFGAEQVRA